MRCLLIFLFLAMPFCILFCLGKWKSTIREILDRLQ